VERFGLVGLPNAGKSSLFNALSGADVLAAPYAFATKEPNLGVATVPDDRLAAIAEVEQPERVVPATVQFVDVGGLVEGASRGEGLGNRFLGKVREVDAIVYVLRAFGDEDVPGSVDPVDHLRLLETELALADLETVEAQVVKRRKSARVAKGNAGLSDEADALEAAHIPLAEGVPLYRADLGPELLAPLRPWFLLTAKPVLAVVNLGEDQLDRADDLIDQVRSELGGRARVLPVSVQLEAEAAQLTDDERGEVLEELGLGEGALPRFLRAAYDLLGRWTFFTSSEKECRAWPFPAGFAAHECAGLVHTDMQRGFIKADVIEWHRLVELGSWAASRQQGELRQEGRDYPVKDGDVVEFRFNV